MDVSIINEPAGIAAPSSASIRGTPDGAGFRDALELVARRRSADDRAASARDVERTRQRRAESDRADEADRRREPAMEAEEASRPEKADWRQRTTARDETETTHPDPSHDRDEAAPAPDNAPKPAESTTATGTDGKAAQDNTAGTQATAAAQSPTDAATATATETAPNAGAAAGQPASAGAPAAPAPAVNATPPAEKAGKTRPAGPPSKDATPHIAADGPDGAAAPANRQQAAVAPDRPGAETTLVSRGDESPPADDALDLEGLWHRIAGKTKKPTSDGPSGTTSSHKPDSNPAGSRTDAGTMAGAVAKAQPQPPAAGTAAAPLAPRGDGGLRQDPASGSQPVTGIGAAHAAAGNTAAQASPTAPMRAAAPGQPPTVQVAIHIARAVQDGQNRISIRLDPPELGRVDVKLDVGHDGKVIAAVAVDRPDTLDLLQRDARGLERALQDAGLQTDGNSLNFSLRRQDQQPDPRFAQNPASGRAEQGGPPPDERPQPVVAMRPASSRALDISI